MTPEDGHCGQRRGRIRTKRQDKHGFHASQMTRNEINPRSTHRSQSTAIKPVERHGVPSTKYSEKGELSRI